jgi:hypothetical protein
MLEEFVETHRDEIIERCRKKVALRTGPPVTAAEIDHGVPMFLGQLASELRRDLGQDGTATAAATTDEISETATAHGHDMWWQGFTASQVVHDYGDVCQSITELTIEKRAAISADDFRVLNKCLDNAIAAAITEHERVRDRTATDSSAHDDGRIQKLAEAAPCMPCASPSTSSGEDRSA